MRPSRRGRAEEGERQEREPADAERGEERDPQDTKKSVATILSQEIHEGLHELERPIGGLFLSALSAGLDIGFSALLVALLVDMGQSGLPLPLYELLRGSAYSVGFILVVFGRSELFTEHTTLAVLPVLDRKASLRQLGRLWGTVYVANLIGTTLFAGLLAGVGPGLGIIEAATFGELAREIIDHPWWVMVLSAILAGWMMGLVSWLVTAGRETMSQIVFVWLVTSVIGVAHLHHCVVGTAEVLPAFFTGQDVAWTGFAYFLALTTVGNTIGGVIFVALIKYAQASQTRAGLREPRYWRR